MKSLKITLLLAVFCVALMGLTHTNEAKTTAVDDIEKIDLKDNNIKTASTDKKGKVPPMT
ncbi:MAG: hypothetical protein KJO49_08095 [Bacteroidia bacterium]|nr:hypothetical protein [Bacteroidia bacterium]MBT8269939.1 hypothetical protein [Bacteroidia bacterium]NNF81936.1 hypothetical protein [Flavobacteriaceae bacterium]NNK69460.1 hypothetical protein [Flavobacteriaceae bacterium]NNL80593.1 hypothetical protein [Flavobacteriaceae bacterium]